MKILRLLTKYLYTPLEILDKIASIPFDRNISGKYKDYLPCWEEQLFLEARAIERQLNISLQFTRTIFID